MKQLLVAFTIALSSLASFAQQKFEYSQANDIAYSPSLDAYAQERCKLDVYYPQGQTGRPVVIWLHGGGIEGGNKHLPVELKEKNMVVVMPNYRLLPHVPVDSALTDAAAAMAWTLRHAQEFGGDPTQIYVSGHSAGGYLLTMVGLEKKWMARYGEDPDKFKALIPFSGQMITHFNHRKMHGISPLRAIVDEYAPLYHVRKDCPPLLLISGDREIEMLGRYEENAYMYRMMKLCGHPAVYLYELGGHDHVAMAGPAFHIMLKYIYENTPKK
ncbi:MAG: alpha/beta hydrolase [Muribaculaceae bacterium]|nr:alpha/beta hydrolase [Muribaculaceae bacterium]